MKRLLLLVFSVLPAILFGFSTKDLQPNYEGIYVIRLQCQETDPTPRCKELFGNYQLILLNYEGGITVSIIDPKVFETVKPLYTFQVVGLEKQGAEMSASTVNIAPKPVAELALSIDRGENRMTGWLRDPQFRYDVKVYGRQSTSVGAYFSETGGQPLLPGAVVGNYTGYINGQLRTLHVRASAFSSGFLASLFDVGGNVRLDFPVTQLYSEQRAITLISENPSTGTYIKWALSYLEGNDHVPQLRGISISSQTGASYGIQLTRQMK